MTNEEMMRPCTLWGQTLDACKVVALNEERKESAGHHVRVCISTPHPLNAYDSMCVVLSPHFMPPLEAFQEVITTIADALNAPVLATEEVLAGLPTEAKFLIRDTPPGDWKEYTLVYHYYGDRILTNKGRRVSIGEITSTPSVIKPNGCHKTAGYLRQFTRQGVRKETKDA
jgi:hypothetical protein